MAVFTHRLAPFVRGRVCVTQFQERVDYTVLDVVSYKSGAFGPQALALGLDVGVPGSMAYDWEDSIDYGIAQQIRRTTHEARL